jgi:predicted permease
MRVDAIINLLAAVALFFMMVAVGLGLSIGDLLKVARDWKLALRAGIANYLLVPAAAVGLLFLFQPTPMVAAGFLIAVICPGAPFAPVLTAPEFQHSRELFFSEWVVCIEDMQQRRSLQNSISNGTHNFDARAVLLRKLNQLFDIDRFQ